MPNFFVAGQRRIELVSRLTTRWCRAQLEARTNIDIASECAKRVMNELGH